MEPWLVTLRWLVRLRWMTVVGQVVAVAVALALAVPFQPGVVLLLVGLAAASNLALDLRTARGWTPSDRSLAAVLLLDVVILTALLALTGGPSNPFSVIYLVQVALAAMSLGPRWAWLLVGVSVAGYGALFLVPQPAGMQMHMHHGGAESFPNHLQGMWLAFAVAASMITYTVTRIASELRSREAEVSRLERRAALNDKLASLSTLAAGAAHELGTPLSTIALVAKELESSAQRDGSSPALLEDARLIRAEVDRCRAILHQLSADAGQAVGELPEVLSLETLRTRLGESLTADDQKRVVMEVGGDSEALEIPSRTVVQVVRNLVRNALDASQSPVKVTMAATSSLVIKVDDRGTGMTPEVLAKAGEPFYTTKPQGKGLGLGLFLARAVAERMGGSLQLQSEPGTGTSARIELPLRPLEHRPS